MAFFLWTLLVLLVVGLMLCCVCCCWQRIKAHFGGQDLKRANAKRQQYQEQELSTKRKSRLGTSAGAQDTGTPPQKKRKTSSSQAVSSGPNASSSPPRTTSQGTSPPGTTSQGTSPPGTSSQGTSPQGTFQGGSPQGSTPQGASSPSDSVIIRMKHQARRSAPEANAHPNANPSNPNYDNRQAPPPVYQNPNQQSPTRYPDSYRTNYPTRPQSAGPRLGYNPSPTRQSYSPAMNNPANQTYQAADFMAQWNANQLAPNDQRIQKADHKSKNFLKKALKHKNPFKWFNGKKKDKGQYLAPPELPVVPPQGPNVPTYVSPTNPPSPQNDGTKKKKKGGFGFGFYKKKNKSFKADRVPSKVNQISGGNAQVMETLGKVKKGRKERMKNWWKKKILRKEVPAITGQVLPPPPPQEDKKSPVNGTPRPRLKGTYQVAEIPAFQGPKKDKPVTIVKDPPVQDCQESRETLDTKPSTKYEQVTETPPPSPANRIREGALNESRPQPSPTNKNLEVAIYHPRPQPSPPKLTFNVALNELLQQTSPRKKIPEVAVNKSPPHPSATNRNLEVAIYNPRPQPSPSKNTPEVAVKEPPPQPSATNKNLEMAIYHPRPQHSLPKLTLNVDLNKLPQQPSPRKKTPEVAVNKSPPQPSATNRNLEVAIYRQPQPPSPPKKTHEVALNEQPPQPSPTNRNLEVAIYNPPPKPSPPKLTLNVALKEPPPQPSPTNKNLEVAIYRSPQPPSPPKKTRKVSLKEPPPQPSPTKRTHEVALDEPPTQPSSPNKTKTRNLDSTCCQNCKKRWQKMQRTALEAEPMCPVHNLHTDPNCPVCISFVMKVNWAHDKFLKDPANIEKLKKSCRNYCKVHQLLACDIHMHKPKPGCVNCQSFNDKKHDAKCTCNELCQDCDANISVKNHPGLTKACCEDCYQIRAVLNARISDAQPCGQHLHHPVNQPNNPCVPCYAFLYKMKQDFGQHCMRQAALVKENKCPIFCEMHQRLACKVFAHKVFEPEPQCAHCRAFQENKAGILCTCEDLCLRCCLLVKDHRSPNVTKPCCKICDYYNRVTICSRINPCLVHLLHPNEKCGNCLKYLSDVGEWVAKQEAEAKKEKRLN